MARLIGIVAARGGSAEIERKNLRMLGLFPLLAWTLEPACAACDLVIVTSDDEDILKVAEPYRVRLHEEPPMLASGRIGDLPVVLDALREVALEQDDVITLLRPTAPFRRAEEIKEVGALVTALHVDSVRSVVPAESHPNKTYVQTGWTRLPGYPPIPEVIHRLPPTWRDIAYPYLTPATDRHRANHPRQWLQPAYRACGFIDCVRADVVIGMHSMEGDLVVGWESPAGRTVDIDSEQDFARAATWAAANGWRPGQIG